MKRLAIGVMFAAGLLFAGPPEAQASTYCNGDYWYLVTYADANYGGACLGWKQTNSGNNNTWSWSNLAGMDGPCYHPVGPVYWNWNDCISSFKWAINSCHWHFGLYRDANFGTVLYSYDGGATVNKSSMVYGKNDEITSGKVYYTSGCVTAPAP